MMDVDFVFFQEDLFAATRISHLNILRLRLQKFDKPGNSHLATLQLSAAPIAPPMTAL